MDKEEIRKARESLRKLHDKYIREFHELHLRIDKYFEVLEDAQD